jgi:hypothetical protein
MPVTDRLSKPLPVYHPTRDSPVTVWNAIQSYSRPSWFTRGLPLTVKPSASSERTTPDRAIASPVISFVWAMVAVRTTARTLVALPFTMTTSGRKPTPVIGREASPLPV